MNSLPDRVPALIRFHPMRPRCDDDAPYSAVTVLEGVDRLEVEVPVPEGRDCSYHSVLVFELPHEHGKRARWRWDVRAYSYLASSPSPGKVLVLKDVAVDVEQEGIWDSRANRRALCEAPQHPECMVYAVGVVFVKAVDAVGNSLYVLEPLEGWLPWRLS